MIKEYIIKIDEDQSKKDIHGGYPLIEPPLELIRCKDCVNCIKEPNGELYCDVLAIGYEPLGSKRVTEDFYCADGERKNS